MKLFKTGILPAIAHGHAGMGMCPSSVQRKRTMAADSCGKRIKTARTTTILHFHFGEKGDPGIWFPLDQLRTWLELQGEELEHRLSRLDIAKAWATASTNMKKNSRWSMVRGPMTATMATLYDLNIIPVSPWKWYPAENPDVDWTYSGGDPGPFLSEMQQRLSHKVWEQAALHYHGLGAENGVDMTILHKHHKRLVARGAHTRAGMLYKIATAQIYDGQRVCEHDPDAQVSCALCGSPDDSMYHRVYDCPCFPTSFELDRTDRIVDEARARARLCTIFWFRGLPPSSWYPELPFAEQPFAEDFGSLNIVGGHVFTDGSGGTETKDPRLRRCGYGVAWILANGGMLNTLGGRAGILHGKIQSVARAELLAAVVALELCANATQRVIIWTDCMFVVNGFARGRRRRHLTHADLWERFWKAHDAISPPVLVHKVWRSHVTTAEITAGLVSPLEAYGNEAADKLAARGALRNALSMEYVAATRHTDNRVWLVQTRLIEINLVHVQNRTKTIRVRHAAPERRAKFDPDEAMRQLNRIGHDFRRIQVGKGRFTYKCRFCLLRGEKPFLKQLLGKPCSVVSRVRSVALPPTPVSTPIPEEPESFFIGDNPSSEEDPFGWGGDFDQDHQDMSDQALQSNPIRSIQHDGMNPDCSPDNTMDQVEPGDATMEDPEPDEAPSGSLEGAYTSRPDIDNSSFSSGGLTRDLGEELRKCCPKSPECISDSIGPAESGSSASQSVARNDYYRQSRLLQHYGLHS